MFCLVELEENRFLIYVGFFLPTATWGSEVCGLLLPRLKIKKLSCSIWINTLVIFSYHEITPVTHHAVISGKVLDLLYHTTEVNVIINDINHPSRIIQ